MVTRYRGYGQWERGGREQGTLDQRVSARDVVLKSIV
jgi:hypothetical protein